MRLRIRGTGSRYSMCIAFGRAAATHDLQLRRQRDADANGYIFGNRLHCPKFVQRHNKSQWLCLIISPNARWGESLQAAGRLAVSGHRATGKLSASFQDIFFGLLPVNCCQHYVHFVGDSFVPWIALGQFRRAISFPLGITRRVIT